MSKPSVEDAVDHFIATNCPGCDARHPDTEIGLRPSYGRTLSREVWLAVGAKCFVQPLNPRAKHNRGRTCEILAFGGKLGGPPDYAVVRFSETHRLAKLDPADLVPCAVNAP